MKDTRLRRRRPRRLLHRIYRVSLRTALLLTLPLLVGVSWYGWSTFVRFERYRRLTDNTKITLDAELFQLLLHDELDRHLRRFVLADPPSPPTIPVYELSVDADGMKTLADDARGNKKRRYVDAWVRADGSVHDAQVRHQGRRHWHAVGVQKSMKVRAQKGDLIDGVRVFNLLNDVTPFGYEEELILDIARDHGLLAPAFHPVRVRMNNADLGVYRFEAQPDEGLLRRQDRMPGSLYSGSFEQRCLEPHCGWGKFAAANDEQRQDLTEIDELLSMIASHSHRDMALYADERIDLDRFAFFDALDVVFGGDQHDFKSNHKLYFDQYRGRFEPIARDFRAFTHAPFFNLAENPLQLRLKALPDYLWRRDRAVYDLLTHEASIPAIETRVDAWFGALLPELRADPYWDAYKLLGRASKFHRFMVRPMNTGRWLTASAAELFTFKTRHRFLLDQLEADDLKLSSFMIGDTRVVEIRVGHHDAHRVVGFEVRAPRGRFTVYADVDLDGVLSANDQNLGSSEVDRARVLPTHDLLVPGIELVAVDKEDVAGPVRVVRRPRVYRYFVTYSGGPTPPVIVELSSLVTEATVRRIPAGGQSTTTSTGSDVRAIPRFAAGETSPHAWAFDTRAAAETIVLGPGVVQIDESRRFERHQRVDIEPNTTLRLGPQVVLSFRGPLHARGTASQPIRIERADPAEPFGGIILRGAQTAGATLRHTSVVGGARPFERSDGTSSLFSIFDTKNITLDHVTFREVVGADDVLHATYVDGLHLFEVELHGAPTDAVDLEHTTAEIRGLRVIGAADECIDLMSAKVRMTDSLLVGCAGNAVSAGEETELYILGSVIARAKVGVLSKNASNVRISRSLVYEVGQGLRTNKRDVHYSAPSRIDARETYLVGCETNVRRADKTKITADVETSFPAENRLRTLRRLVLGVERWTDIDTRLDELTRSAP